MNCFSRHSLASDPFRLNLTELVKGVKCVVKSDEMEKKMLIDGGLF